MLCSSLLLFATETKKQAKRIAQLKSLSGHQLFAKLMGKRMHSSKRRKPKQIAQARTLAAGLTSFWQLRHTIVRSRSRDIQQGKVRWLFEYSKTLFAHLVDPLWEYNELTKGETMVNPYKPPSRITKGKPGKPLISRQRLQLFVCEFLSFSSKPSPSLRASSLGTSKATLLKEQNDKTPGMEDSSPTFERSLFGTHQTDVFSQLMSWTMY